MIEYHVFCAIENREIAIKKYSLVMSNNKIHKYFNRKCSKWNIGFLNECDLEPLIRK